jgi:hypothetical protein
MDVARHLLTLSVLLGRNRLAAESDGDPMFKRLASWGLAAAAFLVAVGLALIAPSSMSAASVRAARQVTGTPPPDHCCCCHQEECNASGTPSASHNSNGPCHDDEEGGGGGDGEHGDGEGEGGDGDCGGDPQGGGGGKGGSHLGTGEVIYSSADIVSHGFTPHLHARSYMSLPSVNSQTFLTFKHANGKNWGLTLPELVQTSGQLLLFNGGRHHRSFTEVVGPQESTNYGKKETLTRVPDFLEVRVDDTKGNVIRFHDNSTRRGYRVKSITSSGGEVTSFTYTDFFADLRMEMTEMLRSMTVGGTTTEESWLYDYITSGTNAWKISAVTPTRVMSETCAGCTSRMRLATSCRPSTTGTTPPGRS